MQPTAPKSMIEPRTYSRRILLAVTGLSPQVVTETLYALAKSEPAFIPTEVHLLTTEEGAQRAQNSLLHADGGQFHALLADYPELGHPAFDKKHIHRIKGPDGQPLPDIRTPQENAIAANAITALMAELTRDNQAALHASIAGGRKTMGFYLGYAFSLFARPQDRLSHVLVSSPFESHPDFFYPPATPRRLSNRDRSHINTEDARITLAEIPVVLLRHGLPQAFQEGRSYGDTVSAVQESFAPPRLAIDLRTPEVLCGNRPVKLTPALMAWLTWWAEHAQQGRGSQHPRDGGSVRYLELYECIVGQDASAYDDARSRLDEGITKAFFQENNAKLNRELRKQLDISAMHYLLRPQKGQRGHYSLSLPPEAIHLTIPRRPAGRRA